MNGTTLLAALLAQPNSVPPSPVPWSYYCWLANAPAPRRPIFKILIQGSRGSGHAWLMTWKDWSATAKPFAADGDGEAGDFEGISWLAKDNMRRVGRIEFTGPFADGVPRMLMIRLGESHQNFEMYDCVPKSIAVKFPSVMQPDF